MDYISIPENFRYSFSKLEAFRHCPRMFALQYLTKPPIELLDNAFAEYGTFCHELLERWAKGELMPFELAGEWEDNYADAVPTEFPPYPKGYEDRAYTAALNYFENFEGFGDVEILSAEQKFVLDINGHPFSGISDLIIRDKRTDKIIVIDHKTKSDNSMRADYSTYIHQLYIYAMYVKQKFGYYPDVLRFNMIKSGKFIDEPFSPEKLAATEQWITSTIDLIEMETEFPARPSGFFCEWICSAYGTCINMDD